MPPSTLGRSSKPPSGRYLSFAEREEVALWRAQGCGVRETARRLGRAPSTISRELRRNAATRSKAELPYDKALYRQRHRIEIMFGRLKDWRRLATRYDRCATTFFGAITLAAIVTFWLGQ